MEGANEEAAARGAANQSKDTEETAANQQRDGEIAAGNGDTEKQELSEESEEPQAANESTGHKSTSEDTGHRATANEDTGHKSTNEDTGHKSPANDSSGHRAQANEDTGHKSTNENTTTPAAHKDTAPQVPTNHDTGHKSTNEDTGHKSPANQDTGHKATTNQGTAPGASANENSPRQAPTNQDPPSQDPTNDVTPVSANQAQDPWDWSLEEAWLRAPEGEGMEMWGAELEDWEEEPDGQWVELNDEGAEPDAEGAGFNDQGAEPADDDWQADADRWWPSPDGSWSKLVVRPGRGLARPGPGSRCRVLLSVPRSGRWGPAPAASGSGRWLTVRPGTAEGRWSCLVDAALETMAAGERARLRPAGAGATVTVQLGRFTAAPPFWAAPPSRRWPSVTAGLARAAALLGRGLLGPAGRAYSRALRAAILAGGEDPEAAAVKAELHAGLALVQLRLGLPAQAAANAGKALALRPAHLEARYRRGLAQAAMMDLEAATADLVAVLRAQPGHAGARRELRRVRGAARERDARLARRLGRLFA